MIKIFARTHATHTHTHRKYDKLISLGLNCEISLILLKHFGDMDSSLFQWAGIHASRYINTLNNLQLIFSQDIIEDPNANMWFCPVSKMKFHGKRTPQELLNENGERDEKKIAAERQDTIGRIHHLCEKFTLVANSAETKLYILGLHPTFYDKPKDECVKFLQEFYTTLQHLANNASFLVIIEENMKKQEIMELDNDSTFFIRCIHHFAPSECATSIENINYERYAEIFKEFSPKQILTRKKSYKFDHKNKKSIKSRIKAVLSYLHSIIKK